MYGVNQSDIHTWIWISISTASLAQAGLEDCIVSLKRRLGMRVRLRLTVEWTRQTRTWRWTRTTVTRRALSANYDGTVPLRSTDGTWSAPGPATGEDRDMSSWMISNRLRLNSFNTEVGTLHTHVAFYKTLAFQTYCIIVFFRTTELV